MSRSESDPVVVRHGVAPFDAVVLHGGPGAPGSASGLARLISRDLGVLEPWQTAWTVDGLIDETAEIIKKNWPAGVRERAVVLIGHSWGAMLGFLVAARYPALVRKLVMVGSGAFRSEDAAPIMPTRLSRMTSLQRAEFDSALELAQSDTVSEVKRSEALQSIGRLLGTVDGFDVQEDEESGEGHEVGCDMAQHQAIWSEVETLRASGALLEHGRQICCSVVLLHGDYDPHPGPVIANSLKSVLGDFRYLPLPCCGHEPWCEKQAREVFLAALRDEVISAFA